MVPSADADAPDELANGAKKSLSKAKTQSSLSRMSSSASTESSLSGVRLTPLQRLAAARDARTQPSRLRAAGDDFPLGVMLR